MNTKRAIYLIDKLQHDWYKPPTNFYKKRGEFEYESYKYSAINEIKFYLASHRGDDAISLIEEFRHMVDDFACYAENGSANFMFSVYYDVATDVLDMLLNVK